MNLDTLTSRKIGGIPVLYIVAVAVLVGLYAAFKMKPTPAQNDTADDQAADPSTGDGLSGDGPDTNQPVFIANPVIQQPSAQPIEQTNEMWARKAIEWLISPQGGETLSVASTAISGYLNGETLSWEEGQARDKAVKQFGLPPEGILTAVTGPKPLKPKPTPTPVKPAPVVPKYYKATASTRTAVAIAAKNGTTRPKILALNPHMRFPVPVGTRVRVH